MRPLALALVALATAAQGNDERMHSLVQGLIENAAPKHSRVGVMVVELATGRELVSIDADSSFTPASTAKVATAAAALLCLDREYRFDTLLESDAPPDDDGVLRGNLYLIGAGDPDLPLGALYELATGLRGRGVARVTGDLVCDESFLDTVREGPTWAEEGSNWYSAPMSALSVNDNCVALWVRPGTMDGDTLLWRIAPATNAMTVVNRGATGKPDRRTRLSVDRRWATGEMVIEIEGRMATDERERLYVEDVVNPALFAGVLFREALSRSGVTLGGDVRTGEAPLLSTRLDRHRSAPLDQCIAMMLRDSDNLSAELVLKVMGAECRRPPGTSADGRAVADSTLAGIGVDVRQFHLVDGSGLSRENRVTPRGLVELLRAMALHPKVGHEFIASLPVAAVDGTLSDRMIGTSADGNVRAKTGTLSGVSSLAGYARAPDGTDVVFAVMMEGYRTRDREKARELQDRIANACAEWTR